MKRVVPPPLSILATNELRSLERSAPIAIASCHYIHSRVYLHPLPFTIDPLVQTYRLLVKQLWNSTAESYRWGVRDAR